MDEKTKVAQLLFSKGHHWIIGWSTLVEKLMDSLGFVCQTAICLQVLLVNIVPCVVQCFSPHGFAMVCPCLSTNETYHGMFLLEKGSSIIGLWVSGYSIFKQKPSYVPLSDMPMMPMVGHLWHLLPHVHCILQEPLEEWWKKIVISSPGEQGYGMWWLILRSWRATSIYWSFFGVPSFVPQNGWFIMDNAIDIDNLGPCLRNPHLGCWMQWPLSLRYA